MSGLPNMTPKNSAKLDYISQLPDAILQHILFFLPPPDAAKASTLSKTWLRVWKSLPLFTFSFDQHKLGMPVPDFVTRINQSLSPLQNDMAIIQSFSLHMSLSQDQMDFVSVIDNWVCLVMKNYVKQLHIGILSRRNFLLPKATLTSKSLVVLNLYGCELPATLFADAQHFNCLKELSLLDVVANEDQIQNLIRSFPSLERLNLSLCDTIKCLVLDNFLMLHYVDTDVKILKLDAINLHTLKVFGLLELHTSNSTLNIKDLQCNFSPQIPDANNLLREVVSKFPLLECLALSLSNNVRFKIQHCHLQTLSLYGIYQEPREVEIDAPNLCRFCCDGSLFPFLCVTSTSIKECEALQLCILSIPDGSHIHQLGTFLQHFNPNIEVNLDILCTENSLTLTQLQEENANISRPSKVRKLVLYSISASSNYTSFLDGLLWTCHPSTMLIEKCIVTSDFFKFLCCELLGRQGNPTCCRDNLLLKCWRHFLKAAKVQYYDRYNFSHTLSLCDTGKRVKFSFEWLEDPVM